MDAKATIETLADRCVLCGMCLPHCPTFRATRSEAESPRGRISLLLALARGELAPTDALTAHIDNCVACRACEAMCPSEVAYDRILVAGRALLRERGAGQRRPRGAALLGDSGLGGRTLRGLTRVYRASGLQPFAGRLLGGSRLGRLNDLLPRNGGGARLPAFSPGSDSGTSRGSVVLFAGCSGAVLEPETLAAAMRLLNRLGFGVHLPKTPMCCGALDLHAGEPEVGTGKLRASVEALAAYDAHAVLGIASGCTATLSEAGNWLAAEGQTVAVQDITTFLSDLPGLEALAPPAVDATVAVHEPCSLRNTLKGGGATERLFARLGVSTTPLPGNEHCCGAAGEYMLTHPESADALRAPKLDAARRLSPDYLVSGNIGCARHLAAGLGRTVEVLHPVVLAERLIAAPHGEVQDTRCEVQDARD